MAESKQELRERIGDLAYEVTQNAATEYAFTGDVYCIIKMYIIADEKCAKLHVQNAHFCRAF